MEAAALRGPPSENPRGLRARVQQVGLGEVLAHVRRPSPVVSSLCYTCTFKKKSNHYTKAMRTRRGAGITVVS